MFYTDSLCKQINECLETIIFLKNKINSSQDPLRKGIMVLEIRNTEIHIHRLRKLVMSFNKAFSSS